MDLKQIINETINTYLTEHRDIVYELDVACDIINEAYKSPNDVWFVEICSRLKDNRKYNIRHNLQNGDPRMKWWKPIQDRRDTDGKKQNSVGYAIIHGRTKEEAVKCLQNAIVHLHPWAARIAGKNTLISYGHMEAIIEACNTFFARAYMNINPRGLKEAIQYARHCKTVGLFQARELLHALGQRKENDDPTVKWTELRPWGMIDCDIDGIEGQQALEKFLAQNGITPFRTYLSHDGKHYILKTRDAQRLNFDFLQKYATTNVKGDPNCEFKGDARMILYSPIGV